MRTRCNNKSQGYGQEFMKKIILLFLVLCGASFALNAQDISKG